MVSNSSCFTIISTLVLDIVAIHNMLKQCHMLRAQHGCSAWMRDWLENEFSSHTINNNPCKITDDEYFSFVMHFECFLFAIDWRMSGWSPDSMFWSTTTTNMYEKMKLFFSSILPPKISISNFFPTCWTFSLGNFHFFSF